MTRRISPFWWPALVIASPVLLPALWIRHTRFKKDVSEVRQLNKNRIKYATPVELPELEFLKIKVLVEEKTESGFKGAPGVSYIIETNLGTVLFDIGFGPEDQVLEQNAQKIGFTLDQADALVISHLHPDHMGGFKALKRNRLNLPQNLGDPCGMPCFLPELAIAQGFNAKIVTRPQMLKAGIATTGPLARSLFLMGRTDEQALVANLKGKGIVVITGCGHPTVKKILQMVKAITSEPVYAVCGGFHLPVTDSPLKKPGIKVQMIWGTGKPPWKRITDKDLDETISVINRAGPRKVLLSHHDCCEYAVRKLGKGLTAETSVLAAGDEYLL